MTPLLEQFLSEARDFLQGIGEKLMLLENAPDDAELMTSLFRSVHTLKGNSGLFEFSEMTRVLHAGEDLMDAVRRGDIAYSKDLADRLLDAMDFVGRLCDEIEATGELGASHGAESARLAASLRELRAPAEESTRPPSLDASDRPSSTRVFIPPSVPTWAHDEARRRAALGDTLYWVDYRPAEDCFFQGDDPFFQARGTPDFLWGSIVARAPWPALAALDVYKCMVDFRVLSSAPREELDAHYRYVPDQIQVLPVASEWLAERTSATATAVSQAQREVVAALVATQREVLALPVNEDWHVGRMLGAGAALAGCLAAIGDAASLPNLEAAIAAAKAQRSGAPLLDWVKDAFDHSPFVPSKIVDGLPVAPGLAASPALPAAAPDIARDAEPRFGRRADDAPNSTSLKVDQTKIDRLMNLIGEMVVSKNALPYLADRADRVFGVRDLSREIEAQYSVINRIAEEMQDAIMQVRMMPVSFVFQRFPRLVRDTSRKLGKDVNLVLTGDETEADKNVILSLSDPLMHIVRNSLDHGFEAPEVRRAAGKPAVGTLAIAASQQADRVVIEVSDDGKGIDPSAVKLKAYAKGVIDESQLESISDQEAINLVFAPGVSTMDRVSELSGRGVGMDVVKTAVEKVNGTVTIESTPGKGTLIRLSLPLSMAVTNVMVVEADGQIFGVPLDCVVETVRVGPAAVSTTKDTSVAVLRGRIVPLKSLNKLLGLAAAPRPNEAGELAVLVVKLGSESVGLTVDDFRETLDIILKPLTGVLADMPSYAGSALMGDGSVLMVLDIREILA